jgi:hypothetical protein
MNDIDQLSAVSDLDATGLVSEGAFADLADQITAHPRRKAPGGRRWRPAGLAVAAGVTAAALAASAILTVRDQPARPGATPVPSPAARPAATAAQLVAYATRHAAAESFDPQPHQWLYTYIRTVTTANAPGRGHVVRSRLKPVTDQIWYRLDGAGIAYLRDGRLTTGGVVGGPFFRGMGMTSFGWPSLRYPYLESLPTSPARLTAIIKANLRAAKPGNPMRMNPVDGGLAVFQAVETLEENVVVLPPRLQAGLYGVLARDPAVRFHPSVTDYAGRRGAAFSASLDNGNAENLIVVNTRTYAYMGLKQVALRKFTSNENDGIYHYHKGSVLDVQAVLDAGIVQHPGQRP